MPTLALALTSVLALSLVVRTTLAVRGLRADAPRVTAVGAATATAPPSATPDLRSLAASDLFGHFDPASDEATTRASDAPTKQAPAPLASDTPPDALPEASLALSLQGILFDDNPADRRAIIGGDGPRIEARRVGDDLRGATIKFIEARRVVVEQDGELKALLLKDPKLGAGAAPGQAGLPQGASDPYGAMRRGAVPPASAQAFQPLPTDYTEPEPEPEPEPPEELPMDDTATYDYAPEVSDPAALDSEDPAAGMDDGSYQ
ncbi:MAG: type II secretion system protein N [Gammaproteobacteria bacterium]